MAGSGVVGYLRALLSADTTAFAGGLSKARAETGKFKASLDGLGQTSLKVTSQVERLAKGFSGDRLISTANNLVAAVHKVGGATKLTNAEQTRLNGTLTKAIEKYAALGKVAPKAMVDLARQTQAAVKPTATLSTQVTALAAGVGGFIGAFAGNVAYRGLSAGFDLVSRSVFGMNAELETAQLQFTTLMGNADQAKAHVRGLFDFAAKTPFETGPVIQASRLLRTFGGAALDTSQMLTLVGNAAATASEPINELAFWIGRAYSSIQAGRPFGEAAQRLQELTVLSPKARNAMEALQESGADASKVWGILTSELGRFDGAMDRQSRTWSGIVSTLSDQINLLMADSFRPFFERCAIRSRSSARRSGARASRPRSRASRSRWRTRSARTRKRASAPSASR